MKKSHLRRAALSMVGLCLAAFAVTSLFSERAARADEPSSPLVWADIPDLAVIRVGSTYYMSSTTMHLSPGLPIMKSTDLVNWQMVGYAYDTLADNDALTLQNGKNAYGRGSWASSLRYHNGTFYVSTFSASTGKTHVYRTRTSKKARGPNLLSAPPSMTTRCSSMTTDAST
jgi:beta-xylosidase